MTMGYLTRFSLYIGTVNSNGDKFIEFGDDEYEIIEEFRHFSDYAEYALQSDGTTDNSAKWYSWKKDLEMFSKKYPNIIFNMNGEGEEPGDIWQAYTKNGKTQVCKVKIEFDPLDIRQIT